MTTPGARPEAILALADGTTFRGIGVGAIGETSGEVVFNTSMTGYQEIMTDPSYSRQMLTFTYPHIGNVGANPEDVESHRVHASGIIVRELSYHYSNFRATESFDAYLARNNIVGISGIDTRALVLHLREHGS
ncbi:MAG: carbamoyl-phosphate synthase small subunit, partial [Bdellovibrionales bacterium]|nr:carbamoyl-phosphate synthase small subunit [Bdellovibrionales bacterium]